MAASPLAGGQRDAVQTLTDDVERVLGGAEEDAAGLGRREVAQAGGAGGDGEGEVQGEEGLAALGFATDDAHGLLGPESVDEPAALRGKLLERMHGADRQERGHGRLSAGTRRGLAVGRGWTKSSR
jgi:hypothetical protein